MNKLELINALRDECQISKKEAATIVDLFFDEMAQQRLQRVTGLKSADYALFL